MFIRNSLYSSFSNIHQLAASIHPHPSQQIAKKISLQNLCKKESALKSWQWKGKPLDKGLILPQFSTLFQSHANTKTHGFSQSLQANHLQKSLFCSEKHERKKDPLNLVKEMIQDDRLSEAEEIYKSVEAHHPSKSSIAFALGVAYYEESHRDVFKIVFDRQKPSSIRTVPNDKMMSLSKAYEYLKYSDPKDVSENSYYLGLVNSKLYRHTNDLQYFRQAVNLFEEVIKLKSPRQHEARISLAQLFYDKGYLFHALKHYNKVFFHKSLAVDLGFAKIHLQQDRPQKAIACFKDVLKQDPNHFESIVGLGCAHLQNGEFDKGSEILIKAFETDRKQAAAQFFDWMLYDLPHTLFKAHLASSEPFLAPDPFPEELAFYTEELKDYNHTANTGSSEHNHNIRTSEKAFYIINETIENPQYRQIMTTEILVKVIAFSKPKEGAIFRLPSAKMGEKMLEYTLDKVLTLQNDIPAFGFTSKDPKALPIILFRGTAPALSVKGGIHSIHCNFDPKGVARQLFDHSFNDIKTWIEKAAKDGRKVRAMGYSQGAALAALTTTYFHEHMSQDPLFPSITFHPPGIDPAGAAKWEEVKAGKRFPLIVQFPVKSDIVSRLGAYIIGEVHQITPGFRTGLLDAHFPLILTTPGWQLERVDTLKDNAALSRLFLSGLVETDIGLNLNQFLENNLGIIKWINQYLSNQSVMLPLVQTAKVMDTFNKHFTVKLENNGLTISKK